VFATFLFTICQLFLVGPVPWVRRGLFFCLPKVAPLLVLVISNSPKLVPRLFADSCFIFFWFDAGSDSGLPSSCHLSHFFATIHPLSFFGGGSPKGTCPVPSVFPHHVLRIIPMIPIGFLWNFGPKTWFHVVHFEQLYLFVAAIVSLLLLGW
jgi:hypothetical protein